MSPHAPPCSPHAPSCSPHAHLVVMQLLHAPGQLHCGQAGPPSTEALIQVLGVLQEVRDLQETSRRCQDYCMARALGGHNTSRGHRAQARYIQGVEKCGGMMQVKPVGITIARMQYAQDVNWMQGIIKCCMPSLHHVSCGPYMRHCQQHSASAYGLHLTHLFACGLTKLFLCVIQGEVHTVGLIC